MTPEASHPKRRGERAGDRENRPRCQGARRPLADVLSSRDSTCSNASASGPDGSPTREKSVEVAAFPNGLLESPVPGQQVPIWFPERSSAGISAGWCGGGARSNSSVHRRVVAGLGGNVAIDVRAPRGNVRPAHRRDHTPLIACFLFVSLMSRSRLSDRHTAPPVELHRPRAPTGARAGTRAQYWDRSPLRWPLYGSGRFQTRVPAIHRPRSSGDRAPLS